MFSRGIRNGQDSLILKKGVETVGEVPKILAYDLDWATSSRISGVLV